MSIGCGGVDIGQLPWWGEGGSETWDVGTLLSWWGGGRGGGGGGRGFSPSWYLESSSSSKHI